MQVKQAIIRCVRYRNRYIDNFRDARVTIANNKYQREKQIEEMIKNGASKEVAYCIVNMTSYQPWWNLRKD